jgi:decaprenyl-phosphate phosphoribosyltransferase
MSESTRGAHSRSERAAADTATRRREQEPGRADGHPLARLEALPRPGTADDGGRPREESLPRALLRAARPRQWAKNVLVFAAPGAAGVLTQGVALAQVSLTFAAFCLVASGTYLLNDARDADADRAHPRKRHRPIASGRVSVRLAVVVGATLMVAGTAVAAAVGLGLVGLVCLYLAINFAYTLWLKHVAIVDLAAVASGFIIRAVAGGVAVSVPISNWFLIVASFGSLFLVAGKRYAEHGDLGVARAETRATLSEYSRDYLRFVWTTACAVAIAGYCLWAFEQAAGVDGLPLHELSIVPFVLFVLRYGLLLDTGHGGAPEDLVLGDRALKLSALAWVLVFGAGVSLGA